MRLVALIASALSLFGQTTSSGPVIGRESDGVKSWLGISYAAPPTGDLRWRPPQAAVSWKEPRAMDHFGPRCMQPAIGGLGGGDGEMSEDCLTLNIWAPSAARNAAVMFWIHGGAFLTGSGSLPFYNGASLARQGVVVVTINYRLGVFGVFAHPELTREASPEPAANFGFLDQIAALQWVHKNIEAFGGDPGKITIFGESAGAESVYDLMISPAARGLFGRAIAESGPILTPLRRVAQLEQSGLQRAQEWGAGNLKVMRAMPADRILDSSGRAIGQSQPVIDGKYIPDEPARLFARGRQAPVPFLLGANSFEASLMTALQINPRNLVAMAGGDNTRVREIYGDDPQRQGQGLFMDVGFLAPVRFLAAQMEKVQRPAYLYYFSYVLTRRRAQAQGVAHGGEIPFIFDNLTGPLAAFTSPADREMADVASGYWAQFAKTGKPDQKGAPVWPAYATPADEWLDLGSPIQVRPQFRKSVLDAAETLFRLRLGIQ